MDNIIKFGGKRGANKKPTKEPTKYLYTVNWPNVTHIERMPDGGAKVFFIGGNFIRIDRTYEEADQLAKNAWSRK